MDNRRCLKDCEWLVQLDTNGAASSCECTVQKCIDERKRQADTVLEPVVLPKNFLSIDDSPEFELVVPHPFTTSCLHCVKQTVDIASNLDTELFSPEDLEIVNDLGEQELFLCGTCESKLRIVKLPDGNTKYWCEKCRNFFNVLDK